MPANKNAMSRYKILDELLSDRYHNYSLDDLTNIVNDRLAVLGIEPVVRRSIEKDLKYLEWDSDFLVELERYTAKGVDSFDKEKQQVGNHPISTSMYDIKLATTAIVFAVVAIVIQFWLLFLFVI